MTTATQTMTATEFATAMDPTTAGGASNFLRTLVGAPEDYVLWQVVHQTHIDQYLHGVGYSSWMQTLARLVMDERHIEA